MTENATIFQAETQLPTEFGVFRFRVYKNADGEEAMAIATRGLEKLKSVPVRVHSSCFTAEVVSSLKCDCKQQLDHALRYIADHGGVVIYLPQEGRGIGLSNKIRAYALQEDGHDTIEANHLLGLPIDDRNYDDAANILRDLNIRNLKLMTNNPTKLKAMRNFGFSVSERIPVLTSTNPHSHGYLETKRSLMGHMLTTPKAHNSEIKTRHTGNTNRPYVHVNFAIAKSGLMNQKNGEAAELSCDKDWQRVHQLRERYSAVVVGANTWIQDQPQLTARQERLGRTPQRQPDRVIFSGNTACTVMADSRRSFVIGSVNNSAQQAIHINTTNRDLKEPLEALFKRNVDSLLVEGGMTLLKSFISQKMVDRFTIYVCTNSIAEAIKAISDNFPILPVSEMDAVSLGTGTLLSYSPVQEEAQPNLDKSTTKANVAV